MSKTPRVGEVRTTLWYSESARSALTAITIAVVGSLVLGGLTSFGQQHLPSAINSFANSAGGWTVLAFVLIWTGRARPLLGGVLGIVAFEGLLQGYGVVSTWRGFFYDPFSSVFALIGLAAGPVLGVAASLTRWGAQLWRVLGLTPLSAVLVGEGIWGLRHVSDTTSPVFWTLETVLGTALAVSAPLRHRVGPAGTTLTAVVAATGALVFYICYVQLSS